MRSLKTLGVRVGGVPRLSRRPTTFALLLLAGLVPCAAGGESVANAADVSATGVKSTGEAPELRRELAGHNFIPSRFSLDPFVSTYVSSETGVGYGTAHGHTYDLQGNPVSVANYEAGAFAQLLNYQYGFVDWWAVRVFTKLLVYSGLNSPGLASIGTNGVGNIGLGTTVSFKVVKRLRLGGSLDVIFGPSAFFNVIEAVKESIQNGEITSPLNSSSSFTFIPAFVGAWAVTKSLGFTFSLSHQHPTNSSMSMFGHLNVVNGTFDWNLAELNLVPIGFVAGFQTAFGVDTPRFLQFRYEFGLFYTAVKPLNVGLEIVYLRTPVVGATEVYLSSVQTLVLLQYNFN